MKAALASKTRVNALLVALALLAAASSARAQVPPVSGAVGEIIAQEAAAAGLDPLLMRRIAAIESGGKCAAHDRRSSYYGLFQMRGGSLDCRTSARAAMARFVVLIAEFKRLHGRAPDPTEIYLAHQQGQGGLAAHLAQPGRLAWISMASTREGDERGENWAKAAIWRNVPDAEKPRFRAVDFVTSEDFIELWRVKVEGERAPKDTWAEPRECRPLYALDRPLVNK